MITVVIESFDIELIDDVWALRSEGVTLEQSMRKAGDWPLTITAYISLASSSLIFIAAVLDLIKHKQGRANGRTKTIIKATERIDDIKGIVSRYERITNIEIYEEHRE